ncbi:MAG: calcium/sodium antiporter [Bacteroidales bacterium]|nr:calcium/sodium antiporter [Candidatus Cacconaster equi]
MLITIILLLIGLGLIFFGADFLVDGASAIARKAGISDFVIGLTIVGFGTSCPELVVSVTGALAGNSDIAIGNVVGSNIFNTLLILGLTAVIAPMAITDENRKRDIPITIGATFLLVLLGMKHSLFGLGQHDGLSRYEGILFLLIFAAYIYMCFKFNKQDDQMEEPKKHMSLPVAILLTLGGLAALIIGGDLFVDSATEIARKIGVSDKFIAVTLLAGGTSLPELATCIVAAAKKKGQLALGNILGSNVFNILLILGVSATINPVDFSGMSLVDMGILALSSVLLFTSAYTGRKDSLDRFDGSLLLICEAVYLTYLFLTI